jgi:hypothetical protein
LSAIPNTNTSTVFRAGGIDQREHVLTNGAFPALPDSRQPRAIYDNLPLLGALTTMAVEVRGVAEVVYLVAYGDIESVSGIEWFHNSS